MSPTILREKGYRFFFFSREEKRMHVSCQDGEAKFWLDSEIELARNYRLSRLQLKEIEGIIEEHRDEFRNAWKKHSKY